jgi:hypothetical protein
MARSLIKLGYLLSFILFPLLVMELVNQRLANIPLRLAVFIILSLGGAWIYRRGWPQYGWGTALLLTILGYGVAYKLSSFIPDVSNYPFSLGWSEASRYYYASLLFSNRVYGIAEPPSVLHPSRYLLQSLPFIIPNSSLFFHRLWQVILWVVTASLTSWLLIRRLTPKGQKRPQVITLCLLFWTFLFLFQGPIYYHLLIMVILLLWGFDSTRFWRNLILVLFASLWAGISRINWLPVPGLLAASLYLLEVPVRGKQLWRYLFPPAIWVLVGTGIAYASQLAYQLWSGNPPTWFGSSFSSDLLWYRLLPNRTFPMGILLSAVFVSIPLIGLMVLRLINRWREYHLIRLLGLAAFLSMLFIGGVVVSVKIGGGSNLHNLDAYLTLLLVIGCYLYFDCFVPDYSETLGEDLQVGTPPSSNKLSQSAEVILVSLALVFPLYFTLSTGGALQHRDYPAAQAALQAINSATQQAVKQGGEVLFINQRHLLTFDYIQGVPLVPEDELVFLMEMAMSDNSSYLEAFHNDLSHQRFAMIVSEPLTTQYQGRNHSFGEENDAWVERVSVPVLCYYEPTQKVEAAGVVLYTPRADPCR